MSDSMVKAQRQCEVYTFVSSKGGTGKTLIAASFAYLLRSCGWRVVLVDTDFATRGLSLYILGTAIESEDVLLTPENCLAESILTGADPSSVEPRTIFRDGISYDVVFANSDVYEGGAPEERLLGLGEEPLEGTAYRTFISGLVKHLRKNYDYVVIDTRGGIDGSSVVPSVESDGFVVVMEADQLSLGQVHGLLTKISQYNHAKGGSLRGFIVNKGVFSPEDRNIKATLKRLYRGGRTFGIVPSDDDAIRAYQRERVPIESAPGAAFSYYCLEAFDNMMLPGERWPPEEAQRFSDIFERSRRLFSAERRAASLIARLPYVHLTVLGAAIVTYVAYRTGSVASTTPAYAALSIAIIFSLGTATTGVFRRMARESASRSSQLMMRAILFATCGMAVYLLSVDIPSMFNRDQLIKQVREQEMQTVECTLQVETCGRSLELAESRATANLARAQMADRTRAELNSTLIDVRRSVVAVQSERDDLRQRLDAALRDLARVTRDRDNLLRRSETTTAPTSSTGTQ